MKGRVDSVTKAEEPGEVFCNFFGEPQCLAMSQTSFAYERGISEFPKAGLEEAECRLVKAPRVAGAPAALECVVTDIHPVKNRSGGDTNNWLVFGEVVGIHIDDAVMTDGQFDLKKAKPGTRLGYLDYGLGVEIVTLPSPKAG